MGSFDDRHDRSPLGDPWDLSYQFGHLNAIDYYDDDEDDAEAAERAEQKAAERVRQRARVQSRKTINRAAAMAGERYLREERKRKKAEREAKKLAVKEKSKATNSVLDKSPKHRRVSRICIWLFVAWEAMLMLWLVSQTDNNPLGQVADVLFAATGVLLGADISVLCALAAIDARILKQTRRDGKIDFDPNT